MFRCNEVSLLCLLILVECPPGEEVVKSRDTSFRFKETLDFTRNDYSINHAWVGTKS
jgi:hypothetical protein